ERSGVWCAGMVGSFGADGKDAGDGIHGDRSAERGEYASGGADQAQRARAVFAAGGEAAAGPGERGESEGSGGPRAEAADAGERAAGISESAAGAGKRAGCGVDSGSAGRGGGGD